MAITQADFHQLTAINTKQACLKHTYCHHFLPPITKKMGSSFFVTLLQLFLIIPLATSQEKNSNLKIYIIHVVPPPGMPDFNSFKDRVKWYQSFLPVRVGTAKESRFVFFYSSIISGFAIRLTESELLSVRKKKGFVFAYPDYNVSLATTHSPGFLGLTNSTTGLWNQSNYGRGVIIGVLDTGIWPDHPSFSDNGMPPPPAKWKGTCEFNKTQCNNKLIGARFIASPYQNSGYKLPMGPYDDDGHGTHTASTAAGMFVENASINSLANGTASGIAPYAHLAIYKVCSTFGCTIANVLAGMDQAVEDGVDVLSLSLSGPAASFYRDGIAIGAMAAIEKGIFVSCAGGNRGPNPQSASNGAPWILTVGASTMDRQLRSTVKLGSGVQLFGESADQAYDSIPTELPLIYPGPTAGICDNGSLAGIDVTRKVVVCDYGEVESITKGEIVKAAGGAGIIIANGMDEGATIFANSHVLPASHISYTDGEQVKLYINSSDIHSPNTTFILNYTLLSTKPAPVLAAFSSRGPNKADVNILKPDIIGPGVNILAAWTTQVGSSSVSNNAYFNMISGTSMSTPHLSGVSALLKSLHPDWSPAMIKSAMMTTADIMDNNCSLITDETTKHADFFGVGSGHVNPAKADNPGLVYDIKPNDYLSYLCGLNYTDDQVSTVARRSVNCSAMGSTSPVNLNYPSIMVFLTDGNGYSIELNRTVTNVGPPNSTYTVQIDAPIDVTVNVRPNELIFSKVNESETFTVSVSSTNSSSGKYRKGYLTWVLSGCGDIMVRSPLMVAIDIQLQQE
ncbi:Subtilisin-like protease SDD1 [Rhynchospora pubera]|uniref:Subtilisin-like protease SDD1 n=1 Tax=Rhynchospora pubera TaxID=906938 RepID=A0AAV8BUW9_9POAL|nr:Subtilisin-like protease SDD1 [Rhynchospora pubera]